MNRNQKSTFVSELNAQLGTAQGLVVAHYRGLTVKQLTTLRRAMRAAGGTIQVAKNRLTKLATKGTAFEGINPLLLGPTILAYAPDPVSPAKVVQAFADKHDAMAILGGAMPGKLLDAKGVKTLSALPSLDVLRGQLVGLLQAPATKVAGVVQAPAGQLARVVGAYAAKAA